MNFLYCISILSRLIVSIFLLGRYFSFSQEPNLERTQEPILWANSIQLAYGLSPSFLDLLQEMYHSVGVSQADQRKKIPALLEEYYSKRKGDSTFEFDQFLQSTFQGFHAANPDVSTVAENSPIIISALAAQIIYGINDSVFLALYYFLESKEVALEEWDEKFGELLVKYQQLERDLEFRRDTSVKEPLRMLKRGEIEEALGLLRERYEFSIREVDRARKEQALAAYDYGNILELRLKYKEATEVFKDAVDNQPNNTKFINSYCLNLMRNGRYDKVIPLYSKAIQLDSTAYGSGDSSVAMLYNNLGSAWELLGNSNQAIEFFDRALRIYVNYLGQNHPYVARCYKNLGASWDSKGEYKKAIEYYNQALRIDTLFLGKRHPAVAITYNNLGAAWKLMGEYETAIKFYNQALNIDTVVLGEYHPTVAIRYSNLGSVWSSNGKYDRAIEYFEDALKIDTTLFGLEHPVVATIYNNLGLTWHHKRMYNRAINYLEQALRIDSVALGKNHSSMAMCYNNLGIVWCSKGKYDIAIQFYEKALGIDTISLGSKHHRVATRYKNIGHIWESKGEYDRAIEYYNRALGIDSIALGKNHPSVANDYSNLGTALRLKKKYDKAMIFLELALKIDSSTLRYNHPNFAIRYNNLGSIWMAKKEYDSAIAFYERAFKINLISFGENHPKLGISNNNLGVALMAKRDYKDAIRYFQQGISIMRQYLPEHQTNLEEFHKNISQAYNLLGMKFYRDSQFKLAFRNFFSAFKYSEDGNDSSLIINGFNNVGSCFKHLGKYDSALVYLNQGIMLGEKITLKDVTHTLKRLYFHKASSLHRMGRKEEARKIFRQLKEQAFKENDLEFLEEIEEERNRPKEE